MGLDMSLTGEVYFGADSPVIRGFEDMTVKTIRFDIGYWRKHPNLHGYIVETFADGIDECQEIRLTSDDLDKIIDAVTDGDLPHTEGFFFGTSDYWEEEEEGLKETLKMLGKAKDFLSQEGYRCLNYHASW